MIGSTFRTVGQSVCCNRQVWRGKVQVQASQWHKVVLLFKTSIPNTDFCHMSSVFHSCFASHSSFAGTLANRHRLTRRRSAGMRSACLPAEDSLSSQPVNDPLVFSNSCSCCSSFWLVALLSPLQEQHSCPSFQRLWISCFCWDWWQCCYSCLLYTLWDWHNDSFSCALWLPGQVLFIQGRGL